MLFSIFIEYQGCTYVRQISALNLEAAFDSLKSDLAHDTHLSAVVLTEADFTPVEGMVNCWCLSSLDESGDLVLMHVILTRGKRLNGSN